MSHHPVSSCRRLSGIRHLLLDIEGTTCPVTFVADVLFPYARREMPAFVHRHASESQVQQLLIEVLRHWRDDQDPQAINLLRGAMEARKTGGDNQDNDLSMLSGAALDHLISYLQWLIDCDRKVTPLKDLQGQIWAGGYNCGNIQAPLFTDVPAALQRWHQEGVAISTYSSGSIEAQKLLYAHSNAGNLLPLFSHWFDTRIGKKQDPQSYRNIASSLGCPSERVLFISDVRAELDAASTAGMQVLFSSRDGNPSRDPGHYQAIHTYEYLELVP